jgi:Domain of unknown function (DUF397)
MANEGDDGLRWQCSSFCNGGSCVEVALRADGAIVRDSRNPEAWLAVSAAGWRAFVRDCKEGLIPSEA